MGQIVTHSLAIDAFHLERTVRVYLPAAYAQNAQARFPVLYMHDGQNLFDDSGAYGGHSWRVRETMETLEAQGKTTGIIVVGVDNGQERRLDEYSPWENTEVGRYFGQNRVVGGLGEAYAAFFAETLKPFIDRTYRTLPARAHTAVAGSSMGAFISVYLAFASPALYSSVGVFSLASWFAEPPFLAFLNSRPLPEAQRYFLSVGTAETSYDPLKEFPAIYRACTEHFKETLLAKGQPAADLRLLVNEGEAHNEISWAKHFPQFVKWALL